ncbi:hypothetical protein SS05631_a43030 (plasmid) [Sinorhizobium sp. CCBAU 05631]|nr:hypothetical protein SS05631_a43030 [Sinorhizobium sp. CCBAU 05631]ASY74141.1 hypothetical protein SF83666_a45540 [Sinorhizobium fredii CCBAU 83666]GLS12534.1 hypothetical protein GCM10007864_61670 [Sinorhizobium fredii]
MCRRSLTAVPASYRCINPLITLQCHLTGIYSWEDEQKIPEGFRPLRLPARILRAA